MALPYWKSWPGASSYSSAPLIAELKSLLLAKLDKVEAKVDKVGQDQQASDQKQQAFRE